MSAGLYLITLVFHNHAEDIANSISAYQRRLSHSTLPNVPFHMVDLIHGHGDYKNIGPEQRKPMLYAFATFVRTLPISYATFKYNSRDTHGKKGLNDKICRSVSAYVLEHLNEFQSFDEIAVYYDGGSSVVGKAIKAAFDSALARNVASYRKPIYSERRLLQAADYITSIELAFLRYEEGSQSKSYERFFGTRRNLKNNLLKPIRRLTRD